MSSSSLAVSYAAVILADADVEITADKLLKLTETAKISGVEPIYAQLYAKALAKADKQELLTSFSVGSAAAPAAGGAPAEGAAAEAAPAEEAKKQESEEESDFDMGSLF